MKNEKMKILVVDDIKENCGYLKILLGGNGYKVFSAENGKDALEKLDAHKFDLIISDILMPVMDGFEFCRQAKKNATLKDIPFVFYTATYTSQKDEEFAYKLVLKIVKEIIENKESFKCNPVSVPNEETSEVYKLYNERLRDKLEKKMLDLDKEVCEHKATEQKLKLSEKTVNFALEHMAIISKEYIYLSVNDLYLKAHQKKREEVVGHSISELMGKDVFENIIKKIFDLCFTDKKTVRYGSWFDFPGLGKRFMEVSYHPCFDDENEVTEVIVDSRDITERKKAEEKLIEEKEFSDAIIKTSRAIIVGLDKNHKIKIFNHGAEVITGYSREEVLEKDYYDIFFKSEMLEKMNRAWKDIWGVDFISYENPILVKNGQKKIISWQITGLYKGNDDNKHLLISIGEDITDRKKSAEKLDKYARTQEVLLREVNHRVKNNLYALMGMLYKEKDVFERKCEKNQSDFIDDIISRINSLSTVHSLLSASKWEPLNLPDLCYDLVERIVESISVKRSVSIEITPGDITVNSTQAHNLALVINEIITNSIKYAQSAKEKLLITIEIKSDRKNIYLMIKDNGIGFSQSFLDSNFKNTGIGFELIFGIVKESLGGTVSVKNDNGAVFNIVFKEKSQK